MDYYYEEIINRFSVNFICTVCSGSTPSYNLLIHSELCGELFGKDIFMLTPPTKEIVEKKIEKRNKNLRFLLNSLEEKGKQNEDLRECIIELSSKLNKLYNKYSSILSKKAYELSEILYIEKKILSVRIEFSINLPKSPAMYVKSNFIKKHSREHFLDSYFLFYNDLKSLKGSKIFKESEFISRYQNKLFFHSKNYLVIYSIDLEKVIYSIFEIKITSNIICLENMRKLLFVDYSYNIHLWNTLKFCSEYYVNIQLHDCSIYHHLKLSLDSKYVTFKSIHGFHSWDIHKAKIKFGSFNLKFDILCDFLLSFSADTYVFIKDNEAIIYSISKSIKEFKYNTLHKIYICNFINNERQIVFCTLNKISIYDIKHKYLVHNTDCSGNKLLTTDNSRLFVFNHSYQGLEVVYKFTDGDFFSYEFEDVNEAMSNKLPSFNTEISTRLEVELVKVHYGLKFLDKKIKKSDIVCVLSAEQSYICYKDGAFSYFEYFDKHKKCFNKISVKSLIRSIRVSSDLKYHVVLRDRNIEFINFNCGKTALKSRQIKYGNAKIFRISKSNKFITFFENNKITTLRFYLKSNIQSNLVTLNNGKVLFVENSSLIEMNSKICEKVNIFESRFLNKSKIFIQLWSDNLLSIQTNKNSYILDLQKLDLNLVKLPLIKHSLNYLFQNSFFYFLYKNQGDIILMVYNSITSTIKKKVIYRDSGFFKKVLFSKFSNRFLYITLSEDLKFNERFIEFQVDISNLSSVKEISYNVESPCSSSFFNFLSPSFLFQSNYQCSFRKEIPLDSSEKQYRDISYVSGLYILFLDRGSISVLNTESLKEFIINIPENTISDNLFRVYRDSNTTWLVYFYISSLFIIRLDCPEQVSSVSLSQDTVKIEGFCFGDSRNIGKSSGIITYFNGKIVIIDLIKSSIVYSDSNNFMDFKLGEVNDNVGFLLDKSYIKFYNPGQSTWIEKGIMSFTKFSGFDKNGERECFFINEDMIFSFKVELFT